MSTRGWENATATDVRDRRTVQKPSKYRNKKTTVDGLTFDSAKEARRYHELLNLARVGLVRALRVQPRYTLFALTIDAANLDDSNAGQISNRRHPVCEYVADFSYDEPDPTHVGWWQRVVEDVKSVATRRKEVYRLKRKLFEAQYGIQIREVR